MKKLLLLLLLSVSFFGYSQKKPIVNAIYFKKSSTNFRDALRKRVDKITFIYNSDTGKFEYWDGNTWLPFGTGGGVGGITTETDPVFTAWDKDYNDLINKPAIPTDTNTQLTQTEVGAYATSEGFIKIDKDEQALTLVGSDLTISGGNTVTLPSTTDTDTHLTQAEVGAFATAEGFIKTAGTNNTVTAPITLTGSDIGFDETNFAKTNISETFDSAIKVKGHIGIGTWSTNGTAITAQNKGGITIFDVLRDVEFKFGNSASTGDWGGLKWNRAGKYMDFINTNKDALTTWRNGNFGIQNSNPTEVLDVVGNGKFTGSLTASELRMVNTLITPAKVQSPKAQFFQDVTTPKLIVDDIDLKSGEIYNVSKATVVDIRANKGQVFHDAKNDYDIINKISGDKIYAKNSNVQVDLVSNVAGTVWVQAFPTVNTHYLVKCTDECVLRFTDVPNQSVNGILEVENRTLITQMGVANVKIDSDTKIYTPVDKDRKTRVQYSTVNANPIYSYSQSKTYYLLSGDLLAGTGGIFNGTNGTAPIAGTLVSVEYNGQSNL